MDKDNGVSTSPTGLSASGPNPSVSAVPVSIPDAATDDPEPALHSEHVLKITQLDYMRLRSWLLSEIRSREWSAECFDEIAQAEPSHAERHRIHAQSCRSEAANMMRIADGLHARWKPGRAPGDAGRDRLREQAISRAKGVL